MVICKLPLGNQIVFPSFNYIAFSKSKDTCFFQVIHRIGTYFCPVHTKVPTDYPLLPSVYLLEPWLQFQMVGLVPFHRIHPSPKFSFWPHCFFLHYSPPPAVIKLLWWLGVTKCLRPSWITSKQFWFYLNIYQKRPLGSSKSATQ